MRRLFLLKPDVAGGIDAPTLLLHAARPPIVENLHYYFDDWDGDDLVMGYPCFLVTASMAAKLRTADLSGVRYDNVVVTKSELSRDIRPDLVLPTFKWLRISGDPAKDDFSFVAAKSGYELIVSEKALQVLRTGELKHCEITEVSQNWRDGLGT